MSVTSKSREEILEHLRAVLSDLFELKPEQIVPEAKLYDDLDLDSIDAVDLFLDAQGNHRPKDSAAGIQGRAHGQRRHRRDPEADVATGRLRLRSAPASGDRRG